MTDNQELAARAAREHRDRLQKSEAEYSDYLETANRGERRGTLTPDEAEIMRRLAKIRRDAYQKVENESYKYEPQLKPPESQTPSSRGGFRLGERRSRQPRGGLFVDPGRDRFGPYSPPKAGPGYYHGGDLSAPRGARQIWDINDPMRPRGGETWQVNGRGPGVPRPRNPHN